MNPVSTGGVAVTSAMLAGLIVWVGSLGHLTIPVDVAGTLAALALAGGHQLGVMIQARTKAQAAPVATKTPDASAS